MRSITIWGEEGDENSHINEIIAGRKKAFCSPQSLFEMNTDEPGTKEGDRLILKDPSGSDRLLIEINCIKNLKFGEADEQLARDVLDCDLQDFRDAHRFYWEEDKITVNDDLEIVAEYFSIISRY